MKGELITCPLVSAAEANRLLSHFLKNAQVDIKLTFVKIHWKEKRMPVIYLLTFLCLTSLDGRLMSNRLVHLCQVVNKYRKFKISYSQNKVSNVVKYNFQFAKR